MPGSGLLRARFPAIEPEPIIPTLARQLVADLHAGHAAVESTVHDDSATIAVTFKGKNAAIDLHFGEGDALVAVVYRPGAEAEHVNAPDGSLATEVLASMRGER
jgi:hypothetical protein